MEIDDMEIELLKLMLTRMNTNTDEWLETERLKLIAIENDKAIVMEIDDNGVMWNIDDDIEFIN